MRGLCRLQHSTWARSLRHASSIVVACRLSCPTACGILVPWPGIEPASPALEVRFFTTGPPGRSQKCFIFKASSSSRVLWYANSWCLCMTLNIHKVTFFSFLLTIAFFQPMCRILKSVSIWSWIAQFSASCCMTDYLVHYIWYLYWSIDNYRWGYVLYCNHYEHEQQSQTAWLRNPAILSVFWVSYFSLSVSLPIKYDNQSTYLI